MADVVIIIGAPRSGTNMLRDALTTLPGLETWPCDEINYIWRHGNVRYPSDQFGADMARPEVCQFVQRQFQKFSERHNASIIVEKTCANALRPAFVSQIFPDAKYLFIRRNGLDVVASMARRWTAKLDIPYVFRKARYVPLSDLPYYALRYLWNHLHRLASSDDQLAYWGPRLDNMDALLRTEPVELVCARQWETCIRNSVEFFRPQQKENWLEIAYEDFVVDPESDLSRIAEWMKVQPGSTELKKATSNISDASVGKGQEAFSPELLSRLRPIVDRVESLYGIRER